MRQTPAIPGYSGLIRYRALFYQPAAAIRRFQLTGYPWPAEERQGKSDPDDLPDRWPAGRRGLRGSAHHRARAGTRTARDPGLAPRRTRRLPETQAGPALRRTGQGGSRSLPRQRCSTRPPSRKACARRSRRRRRSPAGAEGGLEVAFGDRTRARLVRLVIQGFEGVAPTIKQGHPDRPRGRTSCCRSHRTTRHCARTPNSRCCPATRSPPATRIRSRPPRSATGTSSA